MVAEQTSFTILFSVETGVQALCLIMCLANLMYYWWEKGVYGEDKRMIMGLSSAATFLLTITGAFFLVETLSQDDALIDVYHARYVFYLFAFGIIAWAIAKFLRFKPRIIAAFVLSTVLWWGALAVATAHADDSSARRWFFFGVSLIGYIVSLGLLILTAWWTDACCNQDQVIPSSSHAPRNEEERIGRGSLRLYTFVLWLLHPVVWILGPYAIDVYSLLVQSSIEVGWEFFAVNGVAMMMLWWISPMTESFRHSVVHAAGSGHPPGAQRRPRGGPVILYTSSNKKPAESL